MNDLERQYFAQVESYPPLSPAQVEELRRAVRTADSDRADDAAADLVVGHLRMVVDIARQVEAERAPLLDAEGKPLGVVDLCFAGQLGLMRATRDDDGTEPFDQRAERFVRQAIDESLGER